MGIQDIAEGLSAIPGALGDGPAHAPMPRWWRGRSISEVVGGIQVAGPAIDVDTPGANFPRSDLVQSDRLPRISGSWSGGEPLGRGLGGTGEWREYGSEALAWYSSFHYAPWAWGIFFRSHGVEMLAASMMAAGVDEDAAFRGAFDFLLAHELTHFRVDLLVAGAELASGKALFIPGRRRQHAKSPGYGLTEEGLANAAAVAAVPADERVALQSFLRSSPPGYRDWAKHRAGRSQGSWSAAVGELAAGHAIPVFWTPVGGKPLFLDEVPIFLVQDSPMGGAGDAFVGPLILLGETETFREDMARLTRGDGQIQQRWEQRKRKLAAGQLAAGSHLELVVKGPNKRYSVKVSAGDRAGLEKTERGWYAIAIDRHDRLYRRLPRVPSPA